MKKRNRNDNRKLNILQVHNFYREAGGEDVVVQSEAELLRSHGHRVYQYFRSNNEIDELPVIEKLMLPVDSVFSLQTYFQIRRIIRRKKIDLLHIHNTMHLISPSVIWAAKKEGVPVVMTIHNYRLCCPAGTFYNCSGVCEKCVEKGLLQAVKNHCYRDSYAQSAMLALQILFHRKMHTYQDVHFICLTPFQKEKICQLKDVKPQNVYIKPNFVDDCDIKEGKRQNQILYVGRLDESKGIFDLLQAYGKLQKDFADSAYAIPKLVICGEGKMYFACRKFVKTHHLDHVQFLGQIERKQVLAKMKQSRCVVVPSRWYEGMPMVLVEAYRTKTPVIAPDFGAFSDLVQDDVNGFKYEPHNIDELRAVLSMVCAKPWDMLCSFKEQKIFEKTEPEANYQRLLTIYKRCIRHVRNSKKESDS